MELPPGYAEQNSGDVILLAGSADLAMVSDAVASAGTLHRFAATHRDALPLPGRGTVYAIPMGESRWVVRHYQRGGAIAGVLGDKYLRGGATRPLAELIVSEAARARGIATPRVTAAAIYNDGAFYRADIALQFVGNANDLATLSLGAQRWSDEERVPAWRAAGALLRMCFENGLLHPDLNLKNILVQRTASGLSAHIIDLDRARLTRGTTPMQRASMLARFERSRAKLERAAGGTVGEDEKRALHEGLGA